MNSHSAIFLSLQFSLFGHCFRDLPHSPSFLQRIKVAGEKKQPEETEFP